MKRFLFGLILLTISSCSTHKEVGSEYVREPAAASSYNFQSPSCAESLLSIIRLPKASQVKKISDEIGIIERSEERYTFNTTFERFIETDDGAVVDLSNLHEGFQEKWVIDSQNRKWNYIYTNLEFILQREISQNEVITIKPEPVIDDIVRVKVALPGKAELEIIFPKTDKESEDKFLKKSIDLLKILPKDFVSGLKELRMSSGQFIHSYAAAATASNDTITFYKRASLKQALESYNGLNDYVIRHEFGHILANLIYGSATPDKNWLKAMERDVHKVSSYASINHAEDFAETVELYLRMESENNLRDPRWAEFKYRFAELDEIFHNDKNLHYKVHHMILTRKKTALMTLTFTSAGGGVFYYQVQNPSDK